MGSDEGEKAGREKGRQQAAELGEAHRHDAHLGLHPSPLLMSSR